MAKSSRLNSDFPDISDIPAFIKAPSDLKYSDPEQQLIFDQLLGLVNLGIFRDSLKTPLEFTLKGPSLFQQAIINDVIEACWQGARPVKKVLMSLKGNFNRENALGKWFLALDQRKQLDFEIKPEEKSRFEGLYDSGRKYLQATWDKHITFDYFYQDSRTVRKALFDLFFQHYFVLNGFEYNLEPKNSRDWVWKVTFEKDESIELVNMIQSEIDKCPRGTKKTVFVLPSFPNEALKKVSSMYSQAGLTVTFNKFGDKIVCFVQEKKK